MRSSMRLRKASVLQQQEKDAATKSLAKQRGEQYYVRAKWWFDIGRYHGAAWLCRTGLRLSTGPFMLAIRDQLDELAASCDQHLKAAGLKDTRHLCSIDIMLRGRQMPLRYLAKLTVDELVELELRLVASANGGTVERFLISLREPVENLNYLLQWTNSDLARSRLAGEKADERAPLRQSVVLQIDQAAQYHDGLITFPAFMYESLKEELGVRSEPEYLDHNRKESTEARGTHGWVNETV